MALGKIGELYMIKIVSHDPAPPPIEYIKVSGGIFLDMAIYDFDMVRYLSGSEVTQVYASGTVLVDPKIGEADNIDTALTILKLTNGALAFIDNSREAVYGYDQRVEVFGSKGSVVANNNTETNTVFASANGVVSNQPIYFFLERYTKSFIHEMEQFIQAVTKDKEPPVSGKDGLAATLFG